MEVRNNNDKSTQTLHVGDMVKIHESHYIIILSQDDEYLAQNMNGRTRATGGHNTLEGLYEALVRFAGRKSSTSISGGVEFKIYPSNEYDLSINSKVE